MTTWPEGVQKRVFATLDSTMSEAGRISNELSGPTWILALQQTAARGRRGRAWVHPAGNFSASLIFRPEGPVEARAQRSFIAALALRDTLIAVSGRAEGWALKWPNDVLLHGGKLAGILLESTGDNLVIGIGVNLVAAPGRDVVEPDALTPVSLLGKTGLNVTPEQFLDLLAPAFAHWEGQFTTFGFDPIRREWLRNAARLGDVITARTGSSEITGTFETIDEQGVLVLKAADGYHKIAAADVFFTGS